MTRRRVAITGLGVVSPHGCDVRLMFDALMRGESAIRRMELDSKVGAMECIGAPVLGTPWKTLSRAQLATSDRVSHSALVAADAALQDARIDLASEDRGRVGVSVGTSLGGAISQEAAYVEILERHASRLSPFTLVKVMYNGPAAHICLAHHIEGPSITYTTTCSSSAVSIGEASRHIRHGYADVMLAGGAEALFAFVSIKAWLALQVLAPPNPDDIAASCRPFHIDRNGTVLGEGAAFLVLEEYERARSRGATIYAELVGYGVCNDSSHMTQPSVNAQCAAMQRALADATIDLDAVDYVNAHGTGTKLNDLSETEAVKVVFGSHARELAVSSTKSMHGHLVGAAGALELLICCMAIKLQRAPPTAHLTHPDPSCDLDYVPLRGRTMRIRAAMSNSFAVGGTSAVLIVQEPHD